MTVRTGDLAEHFASDGPAEAAAETQAVHSDMAMMVCLADVQPERLRWLWPLRIPLGKTTLIVGDPEVNKSIMSLDIATRVSKGTPFPDCPDDVNPPGGVVILTAEDGLADTVRPRLDGVLCREG